ncbi:peptide/nickel transport system substrate-binding protein [Rhodococcus sp. OK519]|uniref:ABC transporter substrate-binding protein n=1 Tax=Rhodococcus sp. OK519 TaxID=2135729 RepID=UPI000D3940F7|nr:peptide/nickel transport system substrate-binding protein [Rhodococcus sp. OK519]
MTARSRPRGGHIAVWVVVSALLLGACGGGASGGVTSSGGELDQTAVLRVTTAAPSRNLDPYLQTSYGGWGYLTPVFDRLIMVDSNDRMVPGLATEWNFAADGSYLELTLREGVSFHDGEAFDADAVAANITRGQTMSGSTVVDALSDVTSVEVVDPTHVRLHLAPGTGVELPGRFTTNVGMMISPAAIAAGADIRNDPGEFGSGAYVVTTYVPEESLVLTRAEGENWDPAAGRVAGMEIRAIPDASTRLNGIRTGATDLTWVSSASEVAGAKDLAAGGALNIEEVEFRNVLGVMLRSRGDLADPQLRQAIARAIDPDEINALFAGTCTPYRQIYPADSWAADESYQYPYVYDASAAQRQVKAVGPSTVTLTFGAGTNMEKPANVIQAQLTKAGIRAELNPVPNSQSEPRNAAGEFEAVVTSSLNVRVDPAETVAQYVTGPYAFANDNAEIAALAQQAADPTMSQDGRAGLYHDIWSKTLDEALFIPICHQTNLTVFTDNVAGAQDIPWVGSGVFDVRQVAITR